MAYFCKICIFGNTFIRRRTVCRSQLLIQPCKWIPLRIRRKVYPATTFIVAPSTNILKALSNSSFCCSMKGTRGTEVLFVVLLKTFWGLGRRIRIYKIIWGGTFGCDVQKGGWDRSAGGSTVDGVDSRGLRLLEACGSKRGQCLRV